VKHAKYFAETFMPKVLYDFRETFSCICIAANLRKISEDNDASEYYVPGNSATIKLFLRRTLVHFVLYSANKTALRLNAGLHCFIFDLKKTFGMKEHITVKNTHAQVLVLFCNHITSILEYTKTVSLIIMDTGKEHYVPKPIQELIEDIFIS